MPLRHSSHTYSYKVTSGPSKGTQFNKERPSTFLEFTRISQGYCIVLSTMTRSGNNHLSDSLTITLQHPELTLYLAQNKPVYSGGAIVQIWCETHYWFSTYYLTEFILMDQVKIFPSPKIYSLLLLVVDQLIIAKPLKTSLKQARTTFEQLQTTWK